jgi:hypothetical protein
MFGSVVVSSIMGAEKSADVPYPTTSNQLAVG